MTALLFVLSLLASASTWSRAAGPEFDDAPRLPCGEVPDVEPCGSACTS